MLEIVSTSVKLFSISECPNRPERLVVRLVELVRRLVLLLQALPDLRLLQDRLRLPAAGPAAAATSASSSCCLISPRSARWRQRVTSVAVAADPRVLEAF